MPGKKSPQAEAPNDSEKCPSTSRLDKIVTGERSKAVKLKSKAQIPDKPRNPKAKGRKPAPRKRRRRRKQQDSPPQRSRPFNLSFVFHLPADVFIEVANYLSVLDLFRLSQLTRDLHDALLSKNFRPIWRRALQEIGAPDCPPDINEPQFMSLIFDTFCNGCGAPRVRKVDYGLRVRLCPGCYSLNIIRGRKLVATIPGVPKKDPELFRLCYFEGASSLDRAERDDMPHNLIAQQKFFTPDFAEAVRKYYSFCPGSEEQKQFVQRRIELVNEICKHVLSTNSWLKQLGEETSPEANLKLHLRTKSILQRLKELGYTDEDFVHDHMKGEWNKLLKQPRELNERIWQNVLPELKKIISARRDMRDQETRQPLWDDIRQFFNTFRKNWETENRKGALLSFQELKLLPEVKSLVTNAELGSHISENQWRTVEGVVSTRAHNLEEWVKVGCARSLISARRWAGLPRLFDMQPGKGVDLDVLTHAASFMSPLEGCYRIFTFTDFESKLRNDASYRLAPPWKPLDLRSDIIEMASFLLHFLGLPARTSMSDMEGLGRVFTCRCCDRRPSLKFTWKGLMWHFRDEISLYRRITRLLEKSPEVKMTVIDSHNIDASMKLADMEPGKADVEPQIDHHTEFRYCPVCESVFPNQSLFHGPLECVNAHLRSTHGVVSTEQYLESPSSA